MANGSPSGGRDKRGPISFTTDTFVDEPGATVAAVVDVVVDVLEDGINVDETADVDSLISDGGVDDEADDDAEAGLLNAVGGDSSEEDGRGMEPGLSSFTAAALLAVDSSIGIVDLSSSRVNVRFSTAANRSYRSEAESHIDEAGDDNNDRKSVNV